MKYVDKIRMPKFQQKKLVLSNDKPEDIRKRVMELHDSLIGRRYMTKKIIGSKKDEYIMFKVFSSSGKCMEKLCTCKGFFYRNKCRHVKLFK